jgi:hypothetical protein
MSHVAPTGYSTVHALHDFLLMNAGDQSQQRSLASRVDLNCSQLLRDAKMTAAEPTRAFCVRKLCSEVECDYIRRVTRPLMMSTEDQFLQRHRFSQRALIMSESVAEELFRRLLPHISAADYVGRVPLSFGCGGSWTPVRLNPVLKIASYAPTTRGHFAEYHDGPWTPRWDEASLFAVCLYLNRIENLQEHQSFSCSTSSLRAHGETFLLGSGSCEIVGQKEGRSKGVLSIKPEIGAALVFNQDCWQGSAQTPVEKMVLYTEVIFRRTHSAYVDRCLAIAPSGRRRSETYSSSMRAMDRGDPIDFFEYYEQAVQEQRDEIGRGAADLGAASFPLTKVGPNILSLILRFSGLESLLAMMVVSRATYYSVIQLPLWFDLACEQFPCSVVGLWSQSLMSAVACCYSDSLTNEKEKTKFPAIPFVPLDWMSVFNQLCLSSKHFRPIVLSLPTCGDPILYFHERLANINTLGKFRSRGLLKEICVFRDDVAHGSVSAVLPSLYSSAGSASPLQLNMPCKERFLLHCHDFDVSEYRYNMPIPSLDPTALYVDWSILVVPVEFLVDPTKNPFVLIGSPHWFMAPNIKSDAAVELSSRSQLLWEVEQQFLDQFRAPAIVTVHPAVVAVMAARLESDAEFPSSSEAELLDLARSAVTFNKTSGSTLGTQEAKGAKTAADATASAAGVEEYVRVLFLSSYGLFSCMVSRSSLLPQPVVKMLHHWAIDSESLVSTARGFLEHSVDNATADVSDPLWGGNNGKELVIVRDENCCFRDALDEFVTDRKKTKEHGFVPVRLVTQLGLCRVAQVMSQSPFLHQLCTFRL